MAFPIPVFIDHYASGPSGITTYADHLAATMPDLCRINLHASPTAAPRGAAAIDVAPERSHDPHHLADLLIDVVRRHAGQRVAWLPNVGDVSWAGAWRALTRLSAAEREQVRLFGIVHGDQQSQYDAMRRYAPIVAGLAGVSRQCVARLQADGAADAPSVDLLNYPVDVPDARSQTAPRRADETRPLRLLYAGRLEESQKRVSRLPELFRQLASAQIPFSASVAGDGPARASLEAQIAALPRDVASCIRLLGTVPHDEMAGVLRQHDVLVLVSAFEGTPLVLLEAMGSGMCPVLMELAGGLPELVRHDENACVVPQGAIGNMVEAIATLHGDRARLARLGASARATVESRANPATHSAWLRARLSALWERPAPQPDRVTDPDPLGCRVESVSRAAVAAQPASVAVWGAGVVGRQIVDRLLSAGVTPAVMVDADQARHGSYRGVTVTAPSRLDTDTPQIVCVGSVAFADEIVRALHGRHAPPLVLVP